MGEALLAGERHVWHAGVKTGLQGNATGGEALGDVHSRVLCSDSSVRWSEVFFPPH